MISTAPSPVLAPSFKPWLSFGLCAINVLVFLAVGFAGGALLNIPTETLARMGANVSMLTLTGDGWRLLTSVFLHGGLAHIFFNMYMLMLVGPLAERWYGRIGMLVIYLIGGMWASLASAWWNALSFAQSQSAIVSVGASGALMALGGAMLVAHHLHSDDPEGLPADAKASAGFGSVMLRVVGLNVVLGFFIPGVDQAAHIGGLAAGALLGAVIGVAWNQTDAAWRWKRRVFAAVVGVAMLHAATSGDGWQPLRDARAGWDADFEAGERVEQADASQRQQDATAQKAQGKATRLREKAAAAQRQQLPPPVSAKEATGRVWRFEGKGTSTVLELSADGREARALDVQQGVIDALDLETGTVTTTRKKLDFKAYYGPLKQVRTDGMSLRHGAEGGLTLVRDSDQAVQRQWGTCPVKYMGQSFTVTAAFLDADGHNVVAATGPLPKSAISYKRTALKESLEKALIGTSRRSLSSTFASREVER